MVFSTLGRMIWVPVAFVLSAVITILVLISIGSERFTQSMHGRGPDGDQLGALFELLRQAHLLMSGLTIIPALLVIIIGEVARIRSALYYIVGGGLALAAMPLLARMGQAGSLSAAMPPAILWQVFATAGFCGGLVYWLLAGRRA